MNGRRVFHARGKVLGGSSSINGMIFQRGNPMDYERWAAEPGHEGVGLPPLPAVLQADGDLPRRRRRLARRRRAARCSSAARPTNPLFGAFFEAAQEAGYPLTDDVNGYRQEGFARFDRNVHRGRRLSAARAYLHPVREPQEPHASRRWRFATRVRFQGKRAVGVDYLRGGRLHRSVDAGEVILCGGAINTPQLLQLSGVGDEAPARAARHRRRRTTCPASARTSRTTSRSTSSTPRSSRSRSRPACAGAARPKIAYRVAVPPPRARRHQPLRGRRLRPQQRGRRLPEPDVPLPAGRDPVRRVGADRRATATRCTSARCTPTPGAGCGSGRRDPKRAPVDAVQLPVDRRTTAGSGSRRSGSPATSSTSRRSRRTTTASSRRARRSRPTSRSSTGSRADAETALHPSCTAKMGVDEMSVVDPATMRVHGARGPARRRRLGLPVRHQRQHLRPGDDGRREGRRPDRRQHPARPRDVPYYRHRDGSPLYPPGDSRNRRTSHDDDHAIRHQHREQLGAPAVHVEGLWKIFGPRADKIIGTARTPSSPARTCRRRPATWSASATSRSTSRPARCSW